MYPMLTHAHSGIRWVVLGLLIYAIYNSFSKMNGKKAFSAGDLKINLYALIATHVQFLIGLGLYFISPKVVHGSETMKNSMLRFFAVEHFVMMVIAVILITVGYSKSKRAADDSKAKSTFWYYLIALVIMLAGIPWPFREGLGGAWF